MAGRRSRKRTAPKQAVGAAAPRKRRTGPAAVAAASSSSTKERAKTKRAKQISVAASSSMAKEASSLSFVTPCGHSASVQPVVKGKQSGKWRCRIAGPTIKLKCGFKTLHCGPWEKEARDAIAKFLKVPVASLTTTTSTPVEPTEGATEDDIHDIMEILDITTTGAATRQSPPQPNSIAAGSNQCPKKKARPSSSPPSVACVAGSTGPHWPTPVTPFPTVGAPPAALVAAHRPTAAAVVATPSPAPFAAVPPPPPSSSTAAAASTNVGAGARGGGVPQFATCAFATPSSAPTARPTLVNSYNNPYRNPYRRPAIAAPSSTAASNSTSEAPPPKQKLSPEECAMIEEKRRKAQARRREKIREKLSPEERKRFDALDAPLRPACAKLSEQQQNVVRHARPPPFPDPNAKVDDCDHRTRHIVRVTAAAGTGKTTTLIHLALRCFDLGHRNLSYVTFTKASASDAEKRIRTFLSESESHDLTIDASTLHSCAMRLLGSGDGDEGDAGNERGLIDEEKLRRLIAMWFEKDIEAHLSRAIKRIEETTTPEKHLSVRSRIAAVRKQVVFLIFKTLTNFCRSSSSEEKFADPSNGFRHYYPVKIDFKPNGKAEKLGFPPEHYSNPDVYRFYADVACQAWDRIKAEGIRTYDVEMKRAQLTKVRIPGTVLLVDECQDLDACQVRWIEDQAQFGTHVYLVGDAAQTIYGFRGAKSANVMSIKDATDLCLTKSWRFGPPIAHMANVCLYAKEFSPQTTHYIGRERKLWLPYRVEGAAGHECTLMTEPLLHQWMENKPVTIIGRTNASLMIEATKLLGIAHLVSSGDGDGSGESEGDSDFAPSPVPFVTQDSENASDCSPDGNIGLPKIHICGKGDNSGIGKWKRTLKEVQHLHELRMSENGMKLPVDLFSDFAGQTVTWSSFNEECQVREITRHQQTIAVVNIFKANTLVAMEAFKQSVMDNRYKAEEADIILTTTHSAKGLEWDHVQLCDDFPLLASYSDDGPRRIRPDFVAGLTNKVKLEPSAATAKKAKSAMKSSWQFAMSSYGDDLNLLYVACTRAKKTLCVPKSIRDLLQEFDFFHDLVQGWKKAAHSGEKVPSRDDLSLLKSKRRFTSEDVWNFYHDLCVPLRKEFQVEGDGKFVGEIIPDCDEECNLRVIDEKNPDIVKEEKSEDERDIHGKENVVENV